MTNRAKADCFCNECHKPVAAKGTLSAYTWGRCAECGTTNVTPLCQTCGEEMVSGSFPGAYVCKAGHTP